MALWPSSLIEVVGQLERMGDDLGHWCKRFQAQVANATDSTEPLAHQLAAEEHLVANVRLAARVGLIILALQAYEADAERQALAARRCATAVHLPGDFGNGVESERQAFGELLGVL